MKTNRTKTIDYGLLVNSLENECMYFSSNSNPFLASARALPYEPLKSARNFQKITETAVQTSLDKCCFSNAVELLKNSVLMNLDQVQEEKEKKCCFVFTSSLERRKRKIFFK